MQINFSSRVGCPFSEVEHRGSVADGSNRSFGGAPAATGTAQPGQGAATNKWAAEATDRRGRDRAGGTRGHAGVSKPPPVARGAPGALLSPHDDDLTFIEATDLPELMKTATVVDAARTNGYLLDSVHVPQHEWDFLTPALSCVRPIVN